MDITEKVGPEWDFVRKIKEIISSLKTRDITTNGI